MSDTLLLYFDDEAALAGRIAAAADLPMAAVRQHRFPDGELKLQLPPTLPPRVVVLRSLNDPNEKLVELLLTAQTARELGAECVELVAPYLAYMRQDVAFVPGEAVSQRIVGGFLARLFDAVLTFDPHLHRVNRLEAVVPVRRAVVLSGAPLLADLIATRRDHPVLIGPDAESQQWVATAAARHGFECGVCAKVRHGDTDVSIQLPPLDVRGRSVVLLDDVASTGRTLARATELLLASGAASVDVAVTHALFAGDALQVMTNAGVGEVWSTDCIAHASNAVGIASRVAEALASSSSAR